MALSLPGASWSSGRSRGRTEPPSRPRDWLKLEPEPELLSEPPQPEPAPDLRLEPSEETPLEPRFGPRPLSMDSRARGFITEVRESVKATRTEAAERPGLLNQLFDGVRDAWRLYGFGGEPLVEAEIPRKLRAAAEPWSTESQLRRLREKPRAPGESFSFVYVSDLERGRYVWSRIYSREPEMSKKVLQEIEKLPVDFVMLGGDVVSRGTVYNFYSWFKKLESWGLKHVYLWQKGNHDDGRPHGGGKGLLYSSLVGNPDFGFDHGGVRFVSADSSPGRVEYEQLLGLRTALDVPMRKFVFTHMPPGVLTEWTINLPKLNIAGAGGFKRGARAFTHLLSRFHVESAFYGHIHAFARTIHRGVLHVLSGGGGSPLYPSLKYNLETFYHFVLVRVLPHGHTQTVYVWNERKQAFEAREPLFVPAHAGFRGVSIPDAIGGPVGRP